MIMTNYDNFLASVCQVFQLHSERDKGAKDATIQVIYVKETPADETSITVHCSAEVLVSYPQSEECFLNRLGDTDITHETI